MIGFLSGVFAAGVSALIPSVAKVAVATTLKVPLHLTSSLVLRVSIPMVVPLPVVIGIAVGVTVGKCVELWTCYKVLKQVQNL